MNLLQKPEPCFLGIIDTEISASSPTFDEEKSCVGSGVLVRAALIITIPVNGGNAENSFLRIFMLECMTERTSA